MTFIGFSFASLIHINASEIVYLMFGPQWGESVGILKILCLSISLQMILSSSGGVFQAFGATKQMLRCGFFSGLVNVTAIVLGIISKDLEVLCLYLLAGYFVNFFQCFYILHKHVFRIKLSYSFLILLICSILPFCYLLLSGVKDDKIVSYTGSIYVLFVNGASIFSLSFLLYFVSNKYFKNLTSK